MSNHYHLVVRLNADDVDAWSDSEVLERWTTLFKGPLLVQRFSDQQFLSEAERVTVSDLVKVYRQRLGSLSWFMKCLNEPIARQANAEDRCTGHFWEARFMSQALRSEQALISAMAYVDLNPIRAGMATSPEQSNHTSAHARIHSSQTSGQLSNAIATLVGNREIYRMPPQIRPLAAFADQKSQTHINSVLPIRWPDYLELVDTTGRIAVLGKRGRIDLSLAPVLDRLGMTSEQWLEASTKFSEFYRTHRRRLKNVG